MKHYNEIAAEIFERRDAYLVEQKRKRKTVMKITSVACAFAVVAAVGVGLWQGGAFDTETPPVEEPNVGMTTTENLDGTGGDGSEDDCQIHNFMYHLLNGNFTKEEFEAFRAHLGEDYDQEDYNIVAFVKFHNFTREEYMERLLMTEDNIDEIYDWHGSGCPYTKRQWLDAIFGDDAELKAWVFAHTSTWPDDNGIWPPEGDWPPEGYGFGETRPTAEPTATEPTTEPAEPTAIATQPSTTQPSYTGTFPSRDEFGNTTTKP